jgi:two-component system response regulator AlgR
MSEPLTVLLVDDEAPARARLRTLLEDLCGELPTRVVGEAASGVEALALWQEHRADLLLVDIRMPKMDGLELARHLVGCAEPPAVVFVTAYDAHAMEAFEVSAVDYLLKPVRTERLLVALRKAAARAAGERRTALGGAAAAGSGPRRYFSCQAAGRLLLVPVHEVLYLRAEQKYVTAVTAGRSYLLDESLARLEEEFAERFIRLHRGALIARDAIAGFERDGEEGEHWVAVVRGLPDRLPVSRRQWPLVKALARQL